MQRDRAERFLDPPVEELLVVFSEQNFQVGGMDYREVGTVDVLGLAQQGGMNLLRAGSYLVRFQRR